MAEPCIGCGNTAIHSFEGLVRSILDEGQYYVRCVPPLQALHGKCGACAWHIRQRGIPEYCPQCGYPTRVVVLDDTHDGLVPHPASRP
jgi:hypothetical protein